MPLQKLSSLCQRARNVGSVISPATRSSLNLPPLVTYQKLNCTENHTDINRVFVKVSELHCKLHDPLKEQLLWCAYEDEGRHGGVPSFAMFAANRELPQGVYSSPKPDHVPLKHRTYSNKVANTYKGFGICRKDAPMATVIARWTPNSSIKQDQKSALRELAKFGDIESMTPFGRQTVIVVFKEIRSACKAIRAFPPRGSSQNLRCAWHHTFMSRYKKGSRPEVAATNNLTKPGIKTING